MIDRLTKIKHGVPLALFLFSLLVRVTAVQLTHFDGLYGQDSFAYYNYANDLRQALAAAQPPPAFFWPLGYPLLIVLLSFFVNSAALAGQLVSILTGAAIAPLVYWLVLGYQPQARWGAIVAGLLTAVSAQLLLSSLSFMSDAAALFWATLAMWLMVRYLQGLQLRWLVITAVIITFATLTRWVYGLLIVPWGLAALSAWIKAGYTFKHMLAAAAIAVLIGLTLLGAHSYEGLVQSELTHIGDLEVVLSRWNPRYAFAREVTNSDGYFQYEYAIGYFYARPAFHPAYIFPLLAPLWLLGIWAMRRQASALLILLVGWLLIIYLFLVGVPWQNWRFPLALFPPLLILVGLGFDWLWQQLNQQQQRLFAAYCVLALVGSAVWAVRDIRGFTVWANGTKETAVTIAQTLPPQATLLAFGLTSTLKYYTDLNIIEIYYLDEADLSELLAEETAVYLLLDPLSTQKQWYGKSPEQNFRWLQENSDLIPIASYDTFTLYQVSIPKANWQPKERDSLGSRPLRLDKPQRSSRDIIMLLRKSAKPYAKCRRCDSNPPQLAYQYGTLFGKW